MVFVLLQVHGRTFPVQEYFLEDCVEILNFTPPPSVRKGGKNNKNNRDDDEAASFDDDEEAR